jgi:hypothetical protein
MNKKTVTLREDEYGQVISALSYWGTALEDWDTGENDDLAMSARQGLAMLSRTFDALRAGEWETIDQRIGA